MNTIDPSQNPNVEHRIQEFLKALNSSGGKPIETLTPIEARQVLVNAQASVPLDLPACAVEETTIVQDGLEVSLTIVRPAGATEVLPAFLFIHGGGWILGDFPTHERFVRDLVADSGFTAVFVNYTPSPEAHYPTAINEIHGAAKWVAAHGDEMKVDGKRLAIVGNSVGGNMTAAVALMALHKGGPDFKCQVMLWPVTDANFDTGSYREYANGYFLSRAMMQWFWDAYAPAAAQRREMLRLAAPGDDRAAQGPSSRAGPGGWKRRPARRGPCLRPQARRRRRGRHGRALRKPHSRLRPAQRHQPGPGRA